MKPDAAVVSTAECSPVMQSRLTPNRPASRIRPASATPVRAPVAELLCSFGVGDLRGLEDRGRCDWTGAAARSVLGVVGVVEEVASVDQCGRAAAVEVDRVAGAEAGGEFGELGEGEARVDAGAAAVADERDQLFVGGGEGGAWVAASGDVGVELVGAGDESLGIVEVAERCAVADEQRAGLQQVAGGPGR